MLKRIAQANLSSFSPCETSVSNPEDQGLFECLTNCRRFDRARAYFSDFASLLVVAKEDWVKNPELVGPVCVGPVGRQSEAARASFSLFQ